MYFNSVDEDDANEDAVKKTVFSFWEILFALNKKKIEFNCEEEKKKKR